MKLSRNIRMIQEVAKGLGELRTRVVFVGGATTALYIDDPAAPVPTPSDDVDLVVQIASQKEYAHFETELRAKGFKDPLPDGDVQNSICRKVYHDIQVDIMPTDEKILGFSNRWYLEGIQNKKSVILPDDTSIDIFNTVYFLATKLEAFLNRDKGFDIRSSQDLEDVIAVLDGCSNIEANLKTATEGVRKFILGELQSLMKDEFLLEEAAHGFLNAGGDPVKRARKVVDRVKRLLS